MGGGGASNGTSLQKQPSFFASGPRRTSAIYRQKFHTEDVRVNFVILHKLSFAVFVWLTRSVNHAIPSPKIFIPVFVMGNSVVVTWFTIVEAKLQSMLG